MVWRLRRAWVILTCVTYRFGRFELDLARAELRADGEAQPLEPQVFAVLALLVESGDRLVSRDELVEKVWDGRVVSDSAVASRIKSARRALGDDGKAQRFIKTIHGRGVRFMAPVTVAPAVRVAAPGAVEADDAAPSELAARPSIAVLPFRVIGDPGPWGAIADALPHELIAELSRQRWLLVTARGSSFRLRAAEADLREVGRLLDVRYCLTGAVEIAGARLVVTAELTDTRRGNVVWAERFDGALQDVHRVRDEIRGRVLAELEIRIPAHEAAWARLAVPDDLGAWGAFHLGLQHMYRFNRHDNEVALSLFERAVALEPGFARAQAGLSFVHFQAAFLRYTGDLGREIELARRCAERGLELDALDPFVNMTMGRSFWLVGDLDGGLSWLERATAISPSYAQGIYARAWTEALAGRGTEGREHADLAMRLSPLDPLYYAMLGTRALAHLALGQDVEAVAWAERAAHSPGAHVLITMIAAAAAALNGDATGAAAWAANARARNPTLGREHFFRAFPMQPPSLRRRVSGALARLGF